MDGSVPAYGRLAEAYDLIHAGKPYRQDARAIRSLAERYARRSCRSLLEVACGSGRFLQEFTRWYECEGLDASPSMLVRARRRLPGVRLTLGQMESFDLARQFDIVTCLFSSIGYARSRRDLRRTLRNLARHTAPGGVVLVEPWLTPSALRLGLVDHVVARSNGTTVVRMNGCRLRRGRSVLDFHFLVGRGGRVEHLVETHDLGLFDPSTMRSAFRAAGLSVRYLARGLATRRGLYLGLRPGQPPGGSAVAPSRRRARRRARP